MFATCDGYEPEGTAPSLARRFTRVGNGGLLAQRVTRCVLCSLAAYGTWRCVRQQPIPGMDQPLWTIPFWIKGILLSGLTLGLWALLVLGIWLLRDSRRMQGGFSAVRSSANIVRWYRYLNPVGVLYNIYLGRHLLRQFARREVESRYRGSFLGVVWSLIVPLFMLTIYTFVFSVIFKARWHPQEQGSQFEYAVALFAGLIAFNVFAEMVNRSPGLVVSNPNYVKKVVFPLEILPVSVLVSALFHALIGVFALIVVKVVLMGNVSMTVILLPLAALPLVGLTLGVGWFLASLGVYVRDTPHAVGVATQILFFLTPIIYPIEAVPEGLRPILRLNPLSEIVESFRCVLVWNQAPDWSVWLRVMIASAVVVLLGYTWFMKTKAGFADVI